MGKSKNKKPKQSPEAAQLPKPSELEPDSSSPVQAIDGHNTQGWTDTEVKAYNELIIERQKLEKQRQDLEEKCAKSQTQRALLHENVANIDSMFKQQKPMSAAFKFTGASKCCVDLDAKHHCHHEICRRAKTDGVSDIELDTIKYYSMRIHTEKSERMRNALRKQRDLELIRIKKEEEDGQLQSARRSSKMPRPSYGDMSKLTARGNRSKDMSRAAKETEKIVNKIIHQLDDLRSDLQMGKISAEEAQGKLNLLDSKLPAMQDKATKSALEDSIASMTSQDIKSTTESFQNHLRDRLLSAKGDTFSQAFSIMDHFLSATKPDDLQEAISELKDVLQLSGPMCDELQNSLGALEGIFDNPDKLSFTGPDGKQECSSIIDLMDKLKETLKRTGQLPDGANASLTKVFQECIDLEAEAKEHLTRKCGDETVTSADLPTALIAVKEEFVSKSPIPPLTSNKLDIDIANLLDVYDARQLFAKARSGVKTNELEAQITTLVITRTQRNSARYVEKLERLDIACRSAVGQEGSELVRVSVNNVLTKMKKWIQPVVTEKGKQALHNGRVNGQPVSGSDPGKPLERGTKTATGANDVESATTKRQDTSSSTSEALVKQAQQAQQTIRNSVAKGGRFGLWDAFEIFCQDTEFSVDVPMLDKAESYREKTRSMIEDQAYGVKSTVCYLYKLKICPGLAASLVSQALLEIAESSEEECRVYMKELASCIDGLPSFVSPEWSNIFQHLSVAIVQCYVAVYVESIAIYSGISPMYFALSAVEMLTKCTLLTRSTEVSLQNLKILIRYLTVCFSLESFKLAGYIQEALKHYRHFCVTHDYKCLAAGSCSKHMQFARMPHNPNPKTGKDIPRVQSSYPTKFLDLPAMQHIQQQEHYSDSTAIMDRNSEIHLTKVQPRKTIITYPLGQERQHRAEEIEKQKKNDIELAECLKLAASLHENTARKALAILQLRNELYQKDNLLAPTELAHAMDDIIAATNNGYKNPQGGSQIPVPKSSRFSEHLDEPQEVHLTGRALRSASRIRNVFQQLKNGTIGDEYMNEFVNNVKDRVLSGNYTDPIASITTYKFPIPNLGDLPKSFIAGIEKLQAWAENMLSNSDPYGDYHTSRLRDYLEMANAIEPSVDAFYFLASKEPRTFDAYYQIIREGVEDNETDRLKVLVRAWVDIRRLVRDAKLTCSSSPLRDFVAYAVEDWKQRSQEEASYRSDVDAQSRSTDVEEGDEEIIRQGLIPSVGTSTKISRSPAKQPILEKRVSETSLIASQSSISSPELSIQSLKLQSLEQAENGREAANGLVPHMKAPLNGAKSQTAQQSILQPKMAVHAQVQHGKRGSGQSLEKARHVRVTGQARGIDESVSENRKEEPELAEPRYLLPEDDVTHNLDSSEGGMGPESTPASFRMLDMTKHLVTLQKNRNNLFTLAKEITKRDEDEGTEAQRLAEKVAAQVTEYTAFIGRIADWNGVELAREGFEVD